MTARNYERVMVKVPLDEWDEAKAEVVALLREYRAAEAILPLARFVYRRAAIDCDPQTEQMQAAVVRFLERAAARGNAL